MGKAPLGFLINAIAGGVGKEAVGISVFKKEIEKVWIAKFDIAIVPNDVVVLR